MHKWGFVLKELKEMKKYTHFQRKIHDYGWNHKESAIQPLRFCLLYNIT